MISSERQKNNIEPGERDEWFKLEGLAQDGPLGDNVGGVMKNETQEERRNAKYEAEKARREEEAFARDMVTARDVFVEMYLITISIIDLKNKEFKK